jgi:glycosyltransferase involved in cell wall biosynthesis
MRVGIITSSYPRTADESHDAGVFVRDFARKLSKEQVDVTVITPQEVIQHADPFRVRSFPWPGAETSLTHVNPRNLLNRARLAILLGSGIIACLRAFRALQIEHALAMWAIPSGAQAWVARKVLRTPYSVWALGSDVWNIGDYPLGRPILRRILRGAEHLYADGTELSAEVERISGRPCIFLPTSRELPAPVENGLTHLAPDRIHLLCVARFHPNKGVDVLIDAVRLLPERIRRQVQFHIFGGGPQEGALRAKIAHDGLTDCMILGGYVERADLVRYLRSVRGLVIPSRIESIPLVLSDAAQVGCPVIATDVGDVGRLVKQFRMGLVVPPDSPPALAKALSAAVADEMPFDRAGAALLADELSLDSSVKRFLHDITENAAAGRAVEKERRADWGRSR